MSRLLLLLLLAWTGGIAPAAASWKEKTEQPSYVHRAIKLMTDVMVYDIYSPPVASRTYAYISIAGYEAALDGTAGYRSLAGQLKAMPALPKPGAECSPTLAAVQAILATGRALVVSEGRVDAFGQALLAEFRAAGMPEAVLQASVAHGRAVAGAVLKWAAGDNYRQTRTFSRYAPVTDPSRWKPTPPAYMKAVEPHWNKIRPFVVDSAGQFRPEPPTPFSADTTSLFYRQALEVYHTSRSLTAEQKNIADFWDCNPFRMHVNGHVMYATKKISPGGHWINIAALACQQAGFGVQASLEAYTCLAVTLADAFICCWDEKYRSQVIRPESYINQYIDAGWGPLLQTPPFPEYTSGHSVASAAAAVVLTKLFGPAFAYTDSTELEFGLPARSFASFRQAAEEAAISRLYGGIHYRPAIVNGFTEGEKIGRFVAGRLQTREGQR